MMYPIVQQIGFFFFFFFFITTLGSSALQTWQPGACLGQRQAMRFYNLEKMMILLLSI
jgi:hypothetical protein